MFKFKFFLIILFLFFLLTGRSYALEKYQVLLKNDLLNYVSCYKNQNYICMSSYVLPEVIKNLGGVQNFIKLMETVPDMFRKSGIELLPNLFNTGTPSPIITDTKNIISIIPTITPVRFNNADGVIKGFIIAVSRNKGRKWFYVEGSNEGEQYLKNLSREIYELIKFPQKTLNVNNKIIKLE